MRMDEADTKLGEEASRKLMLCVKEFQEMGVSPDFAAFLLLGAGYRIAIEANRDDSAMVAAISSGAISAAIANLPDDEEETVH